MQTPILRSLGAYPEPSKILGPQNRLLSARREPNADEPVKEPSMPTASRDPGHHQT
jgi:hypothetical protein